MRFLKNSSKSYILVTFMIASLLCSLFLLKNSGASTQPRIAVLTDALFSDAGWGAFSYNAGQEIINKHGYQVNFLDDVSIPDIEKTLRNYAESGYNLIICQGFEWGDPALKVAKDFPNTKFLVFTGTVKSENVASIFPRQHEAAYLLGALASMMSKTHIIGFVGGDKKYPNLNNIYEGYKQGAMSINPSTKVLVDYVGDWDSPSKGRQAALSQIDAGADFLLHVADTSGQGVIQAAKERGKYAFGAVSDQNKLAPDTVVTSFILDEDKAYEPIVKQVNDGKFVGKIYTPGLEATKNSTGDGIVTLAPFHGFENKIPNSYKQKINDLAKEILDKKLIVKEMFNIS